MDLNPISASEIRQSRLRLGWSRDQLARQVGVDADTIAAWESGAAAISCPISLLQIFEQNGVTRRVSAARTARTVPFRPDRRTA